MFGTADGNYDCEEESRVRELSSTRKPEGREKVPKFFRLDLFRSLFTSLAKYLLDVVLYLLSV